MFVCVCVCFYFFFKKKIKDSSGKVLIEAPIKPLTKINYFDFNLGKGGEFEQMIEKDLETLIVYIYKGEGQFKNGNKWTKVERKHTLYFGPGDSIAFKTENNDGLGFLILAGKPIKEVNCPYYL